MFLIAVYKGKEQLGYLGIVFSRISGYCFADAVDKTHIGVGTYHSEESAERTAQIYNKFYNRKGLVFGVEASETSTQE